MNLEKEFTKARIIIIGTILSMMEERDMCCDDLENVQEELKDIEKHIKRAKNSDDSNKAKIDAGLMLSDEIILLSRIKTLSDIIDKMNDYCRKYGILMDVDKQSGELIKDCNENGYDAASLGKLLESYKKKLGEKNGQ